MNTFKRTLFIKMFCINFVYSAYSCEWTGRNKLQHIYLFEFEIHTRFCGGFPLWSHILIKLCTCIIILNRKYVSWIKPRKLYVWRLKQFNSYIISKSKPDLECKSGCVCGELCASSRSFHGDLQRQGQDVVKGKTFLIFYSGVSTE